MKRIICLTIAILLLSTQVFAATYYNVNVEGLTYSEKEDLVEWLEKEDMEYDIEPYSSNTSSSNQKELVVEKLSSSRKNTLVKWLENRDYDYSTQSKNGYYYVTIEYTSSTKNALIIYLDDNNYEYESSSTSTSNTKELVVEELSSSQKNTLVKWLKNRDYDYSTQSKNGYYYVTIEYTSTTKNTLINYLDDKNYEYDIKSLTSSNRTGKAYLVANGCIWYADGKNVVKVDDIYSMDYVLFTENGGISYISNSKKGMLIDDVEEPTDKVKIVNNAKTITTNSSGYATYFKTSTLASSKGTPIYDEDEDYLTDNDKVTVYIVKNNMLYTLSSKNKLTALKTVFYSSKYSKNYSNIAFSEYGDLTFLDGNGIIYFNEEIDDPDEIQLLKDENNRSVKARYLNISNGITKTVALENGTVVKFEP